MSTDTSPLLEAVRLSMVRICGDEPVATLVDAGLTAARARQLVENRGRCWTAVEVFTVAAHFGVRASDIIKDAEIASLPVGNPSFGAIPPDDGMATAPTQEQVHRQMQVRA